MAGCEHLQGLNCDLKTSGNQTCDYPYNPKLQKQCPIPIYDAFLKNPDTHTKDTVDEQFNFFMTTRQNLLNQINDTNNPNK